MTVQNLIDQLQEIENKDIPVFVYSAYHADTFEIDLIDLTLTDRVDLNINERCNFIN